MTATASTDTASSLSGATLPELTLLSTDDVQTKLSSLGGVTVLFIFPRTSSPVEPAIENWDLIPGAKGCTPQSVAFAEHYTALKEAGAEQVFGLSAQSTEYQREVAARLKLPFALLSDGKLALAQSLSLPTFEAAGITFYSRITLVCSGSVIERVFYPIEEPDENAARVLEYLKMSN